MTGSQGCSCILSAPSLALIDHHVKKFDVAFISEHRLAVLRSNRYASDTRYFFLWRSREDETVDLCCAIIEARVPPVAFIDPRGSTWRGEDYEEPRRCRCVDCFIKFCATQTIFQQRRSIRAINQPVQWHRHGDPLHDSLFLVDRGSRANPRVVYLRKCTVTWPAGDYNQAGRYKASDPRIVSRLFCRSRQMFVALRLEGVRIVSNR